MTAVYSTETLQQKLEKLVNTQESIQMTSFWLLFHKKHAAESVHVWAEEVFFTKKAQPHRKLFFLNLANDVIQTGKKKGEEFCIEFEKVLPNAFENTFKFVADDLKKHVRRIVQIWRERRVFSDAFLNTLEEKAVLGSSSSNHHSKNGHDRERKKSAVPEALKPITGPFDALVQIEKDQVNEVTRILGIRSVLYLPEEVQHINESDQLVIHAGEIAQSIKTIQNYEFMLDREIKTRAFIKEELHKMLQEQDRLINIAEEKRVDMAHKRETLLKVEQLARFKIDNPSEVHLATLDRIMAFDADDDYPI